jgi:hypothetical protein
MKSREWLEKAAALESDITPIAGGNGIATPRKSDRQNGEFSRSRAEAKRPKVKPVRHAR